MCIYIYINTHTHTGILRGHQKNPEILPFEDVDESREYYAKQNKSIRERQLSHDLTDMGNLRNKTEDHRGREGKMKQDETREGDKP